MTTMVILCDTREQRPPPFPDGVVVERSTLAEADYTTRSLFDVARIERKGASDFASTLSWGRERFDREVARLRPYRWKAIVVEADLSEVYRSTAMHPHAVLGSIASFCARADLPTPLRRESAGSRASNRRLATAVAGAPRGRKGQGGMNAVKRAPVDLANAERPADDKPSPSLEPRKCQRPWLGSASSEVHHWKARALAAEALVAELRSELAALRGEPQP